MSGEKLTEPSNRLPKFSVAYANAKSAESGLPLPPGDLVNLNRIEWTDRLYLLEQSKRLGPIFKALCWDEFWVCIVGLRECRHFIKEHDEHVTPQTLRLQPLFPNGFLRQMSGSTHQHYRRALLRAISPDVMSGNLDLHRQTVEDGLAEYLARQQSVRNRRAHFIQALNRIATGLLIQIFFGARYRSDTFNRLMRLYGELGPDGLVWEVGDAQKQAYAEIRACLLEQIRSPGGAAGEWIAESIIEQMKQQGEIDETMLGNLIYMVEMGRYDMYSLFRWLARFAAGHPDWLSRIASGGDAQGESGKTLREAFVLETLRLEQSERLLRTVEEDVEFGGYLIPKHSTVRLCLWESHKLPTSFQDPFDFHPERFLDHKYGQDRYAPFGLGIHQCPLGDVALQMSTLLLQVMADNYVVDPVNDGPPIRGVYHWEPAYRFAVQLTAKT